MQATITYLLTEQAQRAAMVATGQPVARKQVITAEIPADALDLMHVDANGAVTLDVSTAKRPKLEAAGWENTGPYSPPLATSVKTSEDIIADLRAGEATLLAEAEETKRVTAANGQHNRRVTEEAYQAFLADPAARASTYDGANSIVRDTRSPADWWPNRHAAFAAEITRRNEADEAEKKRFAAEKERAKEDFIATWVSEHGDEMLRAQFADGLACRKAIISMIADAAFVGAGVPTAVPDSNVCNNRDCPCTDGVVDCLPTAVYTRWREIAAKLPEGYSVQFHKVRDCLRDDEDGSWPDMQRNAESATDPYYAAEIKMPHGPFVFERRIKL